MKLKAELLGRSLTRAEMRAARGGKTMTMGCQNIDPECFHVVCTGEEITFAHGWHNGEVVYVTYNIGPTGTCYCPSYGDLPPNCTRQD